VTRAIPIGLAVVTGDAVYNNTHLYLAEYNEETSDERLQALDKIESLHPKAVIAGHGVLDPDSSPRHIHFGKASCQISFAKSCRYLS